MFIAGIVLFSNRWLKYEKAEQVKQDLQRIENITNQTVEYLFVFHEKVVPSKETVMLKMLGKKDRIGFLH